MNRAELVREAARWLRRLNPDLVLSDWGDEHIIPPLWRWSRDYRMPLPLDREAGAAPRKFSGGRTYFSYGRVVYQGNAAPFYGRWHVDRRNSFFFREADLMGLVQIARLGQLPLQQAARASPGTLITSMQLARAVGDDILIPWRKADPERFKSAGELLTVDKGGLVFQPPIGLFAEVAELDFASMYPTTMVIHNISPETVNCRCCREVGEGAKHLGGRRVPPGWKPVLPGPAGPYPLPSTSSPNPLAGRKIDWRRGSFQPRLLQLPYGGWEGGGGGEQGPQVFGPSPPTTSSPRPATISVGSGRAWCPGRSSPF
ncbi:MAG: DNA polymerase domain-containing protein [Desulfobaccales bacterium]